MAKEHETRAEEAWGTLEELLLACAVNRHGTKSWDSIAMEVQNRSSIFPSLTSQHCIDKFNDLKRRFKPLNDASASLVPIIDELRKIRVEELRREVQRRDVSISSLELKVKKLEEERDGCVKEETDLVREKKSSQDTVPGKTTAGEESGDERENRSFNESNSTDQQKVEATTARLQNDTVDGEPAVQPDPQIKIENEPVRSESDPRSGRDWSCNGKSEDVEDDGNGKIEKDKKEAGLKLSQTTGGLGESNELGESVGESKREEKEKEKQNSDVQSSASLSLKTKKRRHRGGGSRRRVGSSSGDSGGGSGLGIVSSSAEEPEGGDEVSPATKKQVKAAVKSELMTKLIETIRSHRLGSVFEQRLRSQESQRYKNSIRQHIDIQTIQSRLDKGVYSTSIQKFFRDLLLLFNNGVVFFRKNSPENIASSELRALVLKEMTKKLGKKRRPETTTTERETKQKPQPTSFSKPNKSSSTIVVCAGKGSSAKTTASESVSKKGSSGDRKEKEVEEKPKVNVKKIESSSFPRIEEKGIRKKRTKDQRSASSNGRNSNKNTESKHKYGGNELSSHDALEMKVERKGNNTNNSNSSKRQGAASFLKRMKQNSPSRNTVNEDGGGSSSSEEEAAEEEEEEEEERRSKESKGKEDNKSKKGRNNREEITERVTRSSRGRNAKEESGRGKRAVGRPPKKQESPRPAAVTGKRGRDNGGSDIGSGGGGGGGGRARKRSRR
ncbi:uncharacterized protein [Euphorbia lathyris]|uniref:uncharacterized protein isoform X2 n=1 Tax=Euphorbia lathyris TaxID=212925 RepID=UPI003313CCD4